MLVFALFTVTVQVAFNPLDVSAVIVAVPTPFAITLPLVTVAMLLSVLLQVTVLLVALYGVIVAVNVYVSPFSKVNDVLFNVIPVTSTGVFLFLTVIVTV
jgi:hypothetical protein